MGKKEFIKEKTGDLKQAKTSKPMTQRNQRKNNTRKNPTLLQHFLATMCRKETLYLYSVNASAPTNPEQSHNRSHFYNVKDNT